MITCYDCKGKGVQIFLGNESNCKPCQGSGGLVVCDSYTTQAGSLVVFRNQRCHYCGVKENDHVNAEVSA